MICKKCHTEVTLDQPGCWISETGSNICTLDTAHVRTHVVACTVFTDSSRTIDTDNGPWFPTCGQDAVGMRADFPMCQEHMDLFAPSVRNGDTADCTVCGDEVVYHDDRWIHQDELLAALDEHVEYGHDAKPDELQLRD